MAKDWDIALFGNPGNALHGWEDHYIIDGANRECHPNYEAVPIGNPYGFMICRKRKYPDGRGLDTPVSTVDPADWNGYSRFSSSLYEPWRKTQIQTYDPYNYYDRTTANEEYLHRNDYLARDIQYNATGITHVHTPGPRKYNEYGYSYTPQPPEKWSITRLHQGYPLWKQDKIYHGASQEEMDELDTHYFDHDVVGTY